MRQSLRQTSDMNGRKWRDGPTYKSRQRPVTPPCGEGGRRNAWVGTARESRYMLRTRLNALEAARRYSTGDIHHVLGIKGILP